MSDELNRLTDLAHQGKLTPSDISDGTFSLSNIGAVRATTLDMNTFTESPYWL